MFGTNTRGQRKREGESRSSKSRKRGRIPRGRNFLAVVVRANGLPKKVAPLNCLGHTSLLLFGRPVSYIQSTWPFYLCVYVWYTVCVVRVRTYTARMLDHYFVVVRV